MAWSDSCVGCGNSDQVPPACEALTPQSVDLRQPRGALVFVKCASNTMGKCSAVLLMLLGVKNGENFAHEVIWCEKQYSAAEIHVGLRHGGSCCSRSKPSVFH